VDPAEVFENVLLADEPDGEHPAGREHDRGAERLFEHEDTRGMVPDFDFCSFCRHQKAPAA
jgi:hypothetical protein